MKKDVEKYLRLSKKVTHRLPANLAPGDESDFEGYASYDTQPVCLQKFTNVRLSSDSVVYKNGALVKETVSFPERMSYYQVRYLVKKYLQGKTVQLDRSKKYLLITDLDSSGHFHWFCEVLPKLMDIKDHCKDFVLLLPDNAYVKKAGVASLQLMKWVFADILFMKQDDFYKVPHLYFVPSVSKGGLNDELMRTVQQAFATGKHGAQKKIYISRQKAGFRKILNEQELVVLLKQYGFEVLNGEDYSLAEQLDIFSACKVLMGIHGAGLTNCFFMQPGSSVVELRKKENGTSNVGYWHLADSLSHAYYYYNGVPDSALPLVGRGCNLTINVKDFEEKILTQV